MIHGSSRADPGLRTPLPVPLITGVRSGGGAGRDGVPATEHPLRDVLARDGEAGVVAPCAVDEQVAPVQPLVAEAELLDRAPRGDVLGADVGLDPVQPDGPEAVV